MNASDEGFPAQHQARQPGLQTSMEPQPDSSPHHPGSGRLRDRVAIVTGGDSGIGRAVSIAFAREGADVAVVYLDETDDARTTIAAVESEGRRALAVQADLGTEDACADVVTRVKTEFGRLDILVNNAGEQHPQPDLEHVSAEQLERTFRTNIFSMIYMAKAALREMREGAAIVNTASVTAYQGHPILLDYASTKGAVIAFTRSLALNLSERGIRVNAVAPGPIWTPLIPSTFTAEQVGEFGTHTPMGRAGQPDEVAPCYVFLAGDDASYMSGQTLHPNGGTIVGG